MAEKNSVTIGSDLTEVNRVSQFLGDYCSRHGIGSKAANRMILALEELLTNTITYGFRDLSAHKIKLTVAPADDDHLRVRIEDDAWPFDPRLEQSPALAASLEERQVGGLGLVLIDSLSDGLDYEQIDGRRNRTTLLFRI